MRNKVVSCTNMTFTVSYAQLVGNTSVFENNSLILVKNMWALIYFSLYKFKKD